MGFEVGDVDMTTNFRCNNCTFETSSEEIFEIHRNDFCLHRMKGSNSEEALQSTKMEVKDIDFALGANKNNETAKRSRGLKKMKEDGMAFKAKLLEQKNSKLHMKNLTLKKTIEDQKKLLFGLGGSDPQQSHSQKSQESEYQQSLDLKMTTPAIQISPEHMEAIAELSLSSLVLGDYLVIVKSDFDLVISEEPYLALMLLLNTRTGKYIARIWNQTVSTGILSSADQLRVACVKHFEHRPCMGCPLSDNEHEETGSDLLTSHTPIPSTFSKSCLRVLGKDVSKESLSCSECLRLNHSLNPAEFKIEDTGLETDFKEECREVEEENFSLKSFHSEETAGLILKDNIKTENADTVEESLKVMQSRRGFPKKCPFCEKIINSHTPYLRHMKYQHNWGSFTCSKCKFKAHFAKDLIEHMKHQNHIDEPVVICPCCKENVDMTEIVTHYIKCLVIMKKEQRKRWNEAENDRNKKARREWEEENLPVTSCQSDETTDLTQEDNIQMETVSTIKKSQNVPPSQKGFPKKCSFCEKVLQNYRAYLRHMRFEHNSGSFNCLKCSFRASFANNIVEHMKEQNHIDEPVVRCPCCKDKIDMSEIVTHYEKCLAILKKEQRRRGTKRIGENGEVGASKKKARIFPRKCSFCVKVLQNESTYRRHIRFIHQGGIFFCLKCKIKASFAKDLIRHMEEEKHTDEPFVICPQCSDKYHMNDIVDHYEFCIKKFYKKLQAAGTDKMCQTCGKTFARTGYNQHLKVHLRENVGQGEESPASMTRVLFYYCDKCGKRFNSREYLKKHIQVEHEKKEYECKTCKQTFKTYGLMGRHERKEHSTDEKYNCKYCGKRFGETAALKSHVTNNHEAPQFKCQYCGKMFKWKNILEAHERIHTGEKPFPCSMCASSFTREGGLAQHMRGVHKIAKRGGQVGWVKYGKAKQGESLE